MALQNVIQISCPKCGMNYELPAEYVGQTGECSQCGFLFAIVDTLFAGETPKSGMLESDSELRSLDNRCVLVRISDFPARVHVVL